MAVKWAVANGNWNVGTTWNDGVVPAVVDEVYLNGHTITLPNNANIAAAKISNCSNEDISVVNRGELYSSYTNATITITANIDADTYGIINCGSAAGGLLIINGNITCTNLLASESLLKRQNASTSRFSIHINGNCVIDGSGVFIDGNSSIISDLGIILNGFVTIGDNITFTKGWSASPLGIIQINGNLFIGVNCDSLNADYIISGNSFVKSTINCRNLTLGGSVEYASTSGTFGFKYDNLLILNPDTFTWKDITEPRSNPFIIVTDADMNNRQQYPAEDEVKQGTEYVWGEKVGTYQQPPESVVLKGYRYDNDEKEGALENQNIVGCVTPEDVRKDVPLVGMGVVGSLVVPSVDDVREGVVFDNGSVGTLIVQGGGDRLRIADFGYYTNAQSDTYIVDLTEQDKPKFAVAEERVLIEMFPDLDLDNIPDKYFDDLFVKYLKYRLIVEYYRTAGINSTFTPSEPTTEIVNYQNVRNEVWLNSANIYLKAWGKKYPESITKPQRILL